MQMASSVVEVLPIYAAAVAMLFLGRMLWPPQVEHTAESLLADIDAPDVLKDHTQEFDIPEVVQVTILIYLDIRTEFFSNCLFIYLFIF